MKSWIWDIIVIMFLIAAFWIILHLLQRQPVIATEVPKYGCYVCDDNTLLGYKGQDSKELRQWALEVFGCNVVLALPDCQPNAAVKEEEMEQMKAL